MIDDVVELVVRLEVVDDHRALRDDVHVLGAHVVQRPLDELRRETTTGVVRFDLGVGEHAAIADVAIAADADALSIELQAVLSATVRDLYHPSILHRIPRMDAHHSHTGGPPVKVIIFVIALAFFVGGMLLMGFAFQLTEGMAIMFFGGIVAIALSLAIPFHFLGKQSH